jgi:hypothetical protein
MDKKEQGLNLIMDDFANSKDRSHIAESFWKHYKHSVFSKAEEILKDMEKGSILLVGVTSSYGRSALLKHMAETDQLSFNPNKKLIDELCDFKKSNNPNDTLGSVVYAREAVLGAEQSFKTLSDAMQKVKDCTVGFEEVNKHNLRHELLHYGGVNGRKAGSQMRDILSRFEEKASSLFPPLKPKKTKFHNNLRSQLNTGGIKWMK